MGGKVKMSIDIEKFIREYCTKNAGTDRLDAQFHEEFTKKFGGKRLIYPYGSCPNLLAMKWLSKLYKQGILDRGRISLISHEVGFPNWVYSYTLNERYKRPHD